MEIKKITKYAKDKYALKEHQEIDDVILERLKSDKKLKVVVKEDKITVKEFLRE